MAITYKTVLAEAVRGYNNIQNALAVNSSVTGVDLNTISKSSNTVSNTATASKMVTEIGKLTTLAALGSITSNTADVSVYTTDGSNAGVNISSIVGTKATTEPTSGYYLAFTGSGSGGKAQISKAGFAPTSLSANVGVTSKTKYFPITAAAGSVSHTVSDHTATSTSNAFTPVISKYTTDGTNGGENIQENTGDIVNTEPTSGYYLAVQTAAQNAKKIVADASISTAGYIPKTYNFTEDTKYVGLNGSGVRYIPINSAEAGLSLSSSSISPGSISKVNISSTQDSDGYDGDSSNLGDIYDSLGTVTTTLPSSGYYLAVKSNSVTRSDVATATASITKAGYMPTDVTTTTGDITIDASSNYYIPINSATFSTTANSASLTVSENTTAISGATNISSYIGAPTTTKPTSGIIYAFDVSSTGTGSVSTSGAGYVKSGATCGTVTVSKTATPYYSKLTEATHDVTVENSISNPSVTVSGTATGFTPSTTATSYYVTVNGSGSNGSVTSNASCISTTGFIIGGTDTASDTDSIAPSISGNNSKIYIPAGSTAPTATLATLSSAGSSASTVTSRYFKVTPSSTNTIGYLANASSTGTEKNYTVRAASGWSLSASEVKGSDVISLGSLESGYYPVIASNLSVTATGTASTSGWTSSTGSITDTDIDSQTVGKIGAGTISTGSASQSGWTTNTTAVVPANGYLYISEGYYPNTQISLATLIPDDSSKTNAGSGQILSNYEAYDTNGNKLIGTIATLTPSTTYYQDSNSGYGALGAGYLSKTYYIKPVSGSAATVNGTATYDTLSGLTLSTSTTSSGITFRPKATSVSRRYTVSTAGWITAGTYGATDGTLTGTTQYVTEVSLASGKTLSKITNGGTITTLTGTGTIGTQSGTQTITANSGTITTTTNNEVIAVTTNADRVNIGTNTGTVNITTPSTGTVNYGEWTIKYNSTNGSLEFIY